MKRMLLLMILVLGVAGCAVNTRYVSYTAQEFPPKAKYYFVSIYPESPQISFKAPYTVIGRVEASGRASEGVTADTLADEARGIARAKGADAIINSKTEAANYGGMDVIPGRCGYRHCRPPTYIPYNDTLLTFRGELITYIPAQTPQNK
ncbi:MAG: hypothetical protein HQL16_04995 [Candidatus Omnitrophica bacterium]|nr:hypothetical protein [Candidatus Omnitrophota bacterium]